MVYAWIHSFQLYDDIFIRKMSSKTADANPVPPVRRRKQNQKQDSYIAENQL
jgi:hypothetical protein